MLTRIAALAAGLLALAAALLVACVTSCAPLCELARKVPRDGPLDVVRPYVSAAAGILCPKARRAPGPPDGPDRARREARHPDGQDKDWLDWSASGYGSGRSCFWTGGVSGRASGPYHSQVRRQSGHSASAHLPW